MMQSVPNKLQKQITPDLCYEHQKHDFGVLSKMIPIGHDIHDLAKLKCFPGF
jgi:hypothetical protein